MAASSANSALSVAAARVIGYSAKEMAEILGKVGEERIGFLEAWNGYFGRQDR